MQKVICIFSETIFIYVSMLDLWVILLKYPKTQKTQNLGNGLNHKVRLQPHAVSIKCVKLYGMYAYIVKRYICIISCKQLTQAYDGDVNYA